MNQMDHGTIHFEIQFDLEQFRMNLVMIMY